MAQYTINGRPCTISPASPKRMRIEAFQAASENYEGLCVACGASRGECEPDARRYPCEDCGERAVFGLEELLMRGCIQLR